MRLRAKKPGYLSDAVAHRWPKCLQGEQLCLPLFHFQRGRRSNFCPKKLGDLFNGDIEGFSRCNAFIVFGNIINIVHKIECVAI